MRAVTLKQAKAHLNELVDAATRGEQVVLLRGPKLVAAIVPVSEQDVELAPRLTDPQAERLWRQIAEDQARGKLSLFSGPDAAVAHLAARARRPKAHGVGAGRRSPRRSS